MFDWVLRNVNETIDNCSRIWIIKFLFQYSYNYFVSLNICFCVLKRKNIVVDETHKSYSFYFAKNLNVQNWKLVDKLLLPKEKIN